MRSERFHNDEARVQSWLEEHARAVRGYLRTLLRQPELADDLAQEVFRRAWESRTTYTELGTPRAYLLRIADRLACDYFRRGHREITVDDAAWSELEPSDSNGLPGDALLHNEMQMALDAALSALSIPQRRVLLLRYYGDMSFEEIAAALDCPLNTALSHCRRGLLALRQIMLEFES